MDIASNDESQVSSSFADFVEIIAVEIIPNLGDSQEPIDAGALEYILKRIGDLALELSNPSPLINIIDVLLELSIHKSVRTATGAISAAGKIFQAMPEELSPERLAKMLDVFESKEPPVIASAAEAWGRIANVDYIKGNEASTKIFSLLENRDSEIRNQAIGYFFSLGRRIKSECSFVLPVLRQIRDNDENEQVRERAGAAIQSITKM